MDFQEDTYLTFSEKAQRAVSALGEPDQKQFAVEIVELYGDALRFLFNVRMQTFVHWKHVSHFNLLCSRETLLKIAGHNVYVRICPNTFHWHVTQVTEIKQNSKSKVVKIPVNG